MEVPASHAGNIFGKLDSHVKILEKHLGVTLVFRDGTLKIVGNGSHVKKAEKIIENLLALSIRGNQITEQEVNYAVALSYEDKNDAMVEIDKDLICHTIFGKPVKPKTLGQKHYVDAIRNKMIVFGTGPAGTGKTYLAMAMAIDAFKKEEVGLIRYYFDYPNTITIIDINTRIIENNHDVCFGERAPKDEILLEDLIKNNIVEEEK